MSSSSADQEQKQKDFERRRWIYFAVRMASVLIAVIIFWSCKKNSPLATSSDWLTVLAILFIPEFYVLYKLIQWIRGKECSQAAELSYKAELKAQLGQSS